MRCRACSPACCSWCGAEPGLPSAAGSEGQGQLQAALSSLSMVVKGVMNINKVSEGLQTHIWSLAAAQSHTSPRPLWQAGLPNQQVPHCPRLLTSACLPSTRTNLSLCLPFPRIILAHNNGARLWLISARPGEVSWDRTVAVLHVLGPTAWSSSN